MVDRRELINVFRQIGIMMGAGVDFLQITSVLRAQTENPRLLSLYDALDHDLTMGFSLADAMARQPDIFSPLAVSLVRQIEMSNEMAEMAKDLAAAFLKIGDYLLQDVGVPTAVRGRPGQAAALRPATVAAPVLAGQSLAAQSPVPPPVPPLTRQDVEQLLAGLQAVALRILEFCAALCLLAAALCWSSATGLLAPRWLPATLWSAAALLLGSLSLWLWAHSLARNAETVGAAPVAPGSAVAPTASAAEPVAQPGAEFAADADDEAVDGEDADGEPLDGLPLSAVPDSIQPAAAPARRNWADMREADETAAGVQHITPAPALRNGQAVLENQTYPSSAAPAAPVTHVSPSGAGEADYE